MQRERRERTACIKTNCIKTVDILNLENFQQNRMDIWLLLCECKTCVANIEKKNIFNKYPFICLTRDIRVG